ncbi:MAG TPA: S8 family serine peptidase [Steroidobacteraceae bacterium]|nr:S8 family serine peptidase [Steroidobacteraceae bacterium]
MRRPAFWLLVLTVVAGAPMVHAAQRNPVRVAPVAIGPEASRIIVGFKTNPANAMSTMIASRMQAQSVRLVQARTSAQDVAALAQRVDLALAGSRQLTPSMHLLFLPQTLYGAQALAALAKLRADPAVAFAQVDRRRYPLAANPPNDPLFPAPPTPTLCTVADGCNPPQSYYGGQWYLRAPPAVATSTDDDLAATDAVDAWGITTGSAGVVIADVDTGVVFDHPDLGRAGFGGRLLPGYDFVGQDYDPVNGSALGTYKVANDGDGWDPDPSDPGDWVSSTDFAYMDSFGNALFPQATCGQPGPTSGTYLPVDSSWHGTRVAGMLGALTDNGTGIAGMTWGPYLLPVRALGKCGGYDSDIITAIEWAAGMPVTDSSGNALPDNPFPANIINLSLGGGGSCPSGYEAALKSVTGLGVLVIASAGNGGNPGATAPVDAPANCSALVPGVVAVAGLRNVGTKVGYSSSGPEVTLSASAGNCVELSGPCLRTLDTTTNEGTTVPGANGYTDQTNSNLGTSFSAPIVAGIAALMRSANANLTPAEIAARLAASATPFPANSANLPICPASDPVTGECSCPPSGQCGAGMVDALAAVESALRPIAAVALPATVASGQNATFDASGSAAACDPTGGAPKSIAAYAWTATGGVQIASGANAAQVSAIPGTTAGTLSLTVTDSAGLSDTATIQVPANGAPSAPGVPMSAGSAATACPKPVAFTAAPPTVAATVSPASVAENVASTLTITFGNTNPYALTQAAFNYGLPSNLTIASSPQTTTSCTGGELAATYSTTNVAITGAVVPANGSCSVVIPVESASAGTYTIGIAANTLATGPAGANTAAATASLTVTAPSSGGGAIGWPELLVGAGLLAASRRRAARRR